MAKYIIRLSGKAEKQISKLSDHIANPILKSIGKLAESPRPNGCIKLRNRPGYRIRQGDYRIIYEVMDSRQTVDVLVIGHRKDIYD